MALDPQVEKIVGYLANEVGERFGGSLGEHRAASVIADEFRGLGLDVELQTFSFIGWTPGPAPRLTLVDEPTSEIAVKPMLYTSSTPLEGVTGHLERYGRSILIPGVFEPETFLLRDRSGRDCARIYVKANGPAIPLQNARPMYRLPQVVIGEDDGNRIAGLLTDGGQVSARLEVSGELLPDAVTSNVIGKLRVDGSPRRVVVSAHYDTTIGTPGAYDNASGVGGIVAIARRLLAHSPDANIDFVAFACEEGGFWGSRYYVDRLKDQGRVAEILGVVNLDQISAGDFLWVWTGPETMRIRVENALTAENAFQRHEIRIDPPKPGADDYPFAIEGIPTVSLIFWVPLYYHTSADSVEQFEAAKWTLCVDVAERIARDLATGKSAG